MLRIISINKVANGYDMVLRFVLEGLCNVENMSTPSHGSEGEYDLATQVQPTGFE